MLQAPSFTAASEGWMSENQILLEDRKKYFFLDIPFYRTFPPHDDDGHFYFAEIRTFELCSNRLEPGLRALERWL
jgi:hypothetical protein